jgi:hypothetical protein
MHGWPVIQSIHTLQQIRDVRRAETDLPGESPLPEALVRATARNVMRTNSRPHSESGPTDLRIRWLVQEALKGLAAN